MRSVQLFTLLRPRQGQFCGTRLCNILAVIEGNNPDEVVIAGAHYDHLGSYPGLMEGDCIFNGADDNVSGTVALLQIAKAFAESGIPCLWFFTGENEDTHTPHDDARKLNIRKITDVAKAAYYVLLQECC